MVTFTRKPVCIGTMASKGLLVNKLLHGGHSQNYSGDLRGVAGGDGKLGCLCGKAGRQSYV